LPFSGDSCIMIVHLVDVEQGPLVSDLTSGLA
jgi:hypothetical protein